MITSFFNTSKPIHFVIVLILALCTFVFFRLYINDVDIDALYVGKQLGLFLILSWSIGALAFLASKNNLSQNNSYNVLLYSVFLIAVPATIQNDYILISNFFVLLALRRIISLRSKISVKKKLFDAAFWIAIASLFHFWSILFFVLIIIALFFYAIEDLRNWIIPFIAFFVVALLYSCYHIITEDAFGDFNQYWAGISLDFTVYNNLKTIIAITVLLSFGLWSSFFYFKKIGEQTRSIKASFVLVYIAFLLGVTLIIITPQKDGSEFLFVFAPLAIIISNYIETINESWFAEVFVWLIMITPVVTLLL
jgi:hypothetical protein